MASVNANDASGGFGTDMSHLPATLIEADSTFDGFYTRAHRPIVRALSLALGDDEFGRDAAAEGFTRALQRWNKVSTYANPAGWVYRVGLNWARSRRRKSLREVHVTADRPAVPTSDPSMAIALRALSIDHRAVVVGRFYLDWTEAQLADALDIPPGTVKSRLNRALQRLSTLLEDNHE